MIQVKRYSANPILSFNQSQSWEAEAAFNGSITKKGNNFFLVYRAVASPQFYYGSKIKLSSIGLAQSSNGFTFNHRRQFITPEYSWERFGCEDPRITKLGSKYYIFYTALSEYPPSPESIKIGVATSRDLKEIEIKHQVTHFNSKAMALFPQKIKDKLVVVLTINTDRPPAKICLAFLDHEDQLWSWDFWEKWLARHDLYVLPLQINVNDHVEVGAPPVKTKKGWLLFYCYIKDYFSPTPVFGIEAVLLDLLNPLKILARTSKPLLYPQEEYELKGKVNNVVFPSGAIIEKGKVNLYYGAADTSCCLATLDLNELLEKMLSGNHSVKKNSVQLKLERYKSNPLIAPKPENDWESKATFNAAAFSWVGKIHIIYRAMSDYDTSVLGYAISNDGFRIKKRLHRPIYIPRENFEKKLQPGTSGCEDPRVTLIDDRLYMCYTAFNGGATTYVAFTSIRLIDFLKKKWHWQRPKIISDPSRSDKNACLFPEKIKGKYVFFHRVGGCIWIDFVNDLSFPNGRWLGGKIILNPREDKWDSKKIGIAGPPHKTKDGWVLIYHGLSAKDDKYRLSAVLLDLHSPDKVLSRLDYPILEPDEIYENEGLRSKTVFSCGSVVKKGQLLVYYGAGDKVLAVASTPLKKLIEVLKKS